MADMVLQPKCPQWGADLLIEQLGDEPEPNDRVFVPFTGIWAAAMKLPGKRSSRIRTSSGRALATASRFFAASASRREAAVAGLHASLAFFAVFGHGGVVSARFTASSIRC